MTFDLTNKVITLTEPMTWEEIYSHALLKECWRIEAESFLRYVKNPQD